MPLFDPHRPRDADLLARMVDEIRALDADEPMVIALAPLSAVQLVGLLQLALRHEGTVGDIRSTALRFLAGVREYFADCPAVLEIIRRGDDPAYDTRRSGNSLDDFLIAEARADVAAGAAHECSDWWNAQGICALCDRRKDLEAR